MILVQYSSYIKAFFPTHRPTYSQENRVNMTSEPKRELFKGAVRPPPKQNSPSTHSYVQAPPSGSEISIAKREGKLGVKSKPSSQRTPIIWHPMLI